MCYISILSAVQVSNNESIKLPHLWPFDRWIQRWQADGLLQNWTVMRKAFSYHNVIIPSPRWARLAPNDNRRAMKRIRFDYPMHVLFGFCFHNVDLRDTQTTKKQQTTSTVHRKVWSYGWLDDILIILIRAMLFNCECCGYGQTSINGSFSSAIGILLTHWGRDNMAAIFQTTFSNAFSWMKMYKFRLRFHWSFFPGFQLTIFQHWFR